MPEERICQYEPCSQPFIQKNNLAKIKRFCSKSCCDRTYRASHHEDLCAHGRAYYEENKGKWQIYHQENSEERRIYRKEYYKTHKEEENASNAAYRAAHSEELAASHAKYVEENPEKIRLGNRNSINKHRDKRNEKRRARYAEHREEEIAKVLVYAKANPHVSRESSARRRAQKLSAPINDLTETQWQEIKAAYNERCVYCPDTCWRCRQHKHVLTKDHIIPLSKGGPHTASNIVPACLSCNAKKGNRAPLKPVQPLLLTIA